VFPPTKLGENPGNLFGRRSAFDCASEKRKIATAGTHSVRACAPDETFIGRR